MLLVVFAPIQWGNPSVSSSKGDPTTANLKMLASSSSFSPFCFTTMAVPLRIKKKDVPAQRHAFRHLRDLERV